MSVIPVLEELRQEDPEFEVSLGYIGRAYFIKKEGGRLVAQL
jgi:hypothetical protein